jgi:hypothetical protein
MESDKQPGVAVTLALAITQQMGGKKKSRNTFTSEMYFGVYELLLLCTYAETNVYIACVVAPSSSSFDTTL